MDEDKLYSFVMRGELTKVALNASGVVSKHFSSESLVQGKWFTTYIETKIDDLNLISLESKVTYQEIKNYVRK